MRTNQFIWLLLFVYFLPILILPSCGNKQSRINIDRDTVISSPVGREPDKLIGVDDDSTELVNYLLGKFDPGKHPDFSLIEPAYTNKSGIYMRTEAYQSFKRMHAAAKTDGITLTIISATRNFSSQKGIWEQKWNGDRIVEGKNLAKEIADTVERARIILRYSSMPGTSRHHWGTDIDINDLNDSYFTSGQGKKEYEWLVHNAPSFGFCQPYSPKGEFRPTGYEEEKWHWSYMPISKELTQQYEQYVSYEKIRGFKGSGTSKQIDVIRNYVLGISSDCMK